jgi:hypothetical protein
VQQHSWPATTHLKLLQLLQLLYQIKTMQAPAILICLLELRQSVQDRQLPE